MRKSTSQNLFVIIFLWLSYPVDSALAQNSDLNKTKFAFGLAFSPSYDEYGPISFHFYLNRPSLKEYHILFATDFHSDKHYYRIESGINWFLTSPNKNRRFQIFPSTSLSYIYRETKTGSPQLMYESRETFISLGLNSNILVLENIQFTGRVQYGWGQQWENSQTITNSISDNTAFNVFYYLGVKILIFRH